MWMQGSIAGTIGDEGRLKNSQKNRNFGGGGGGGGGRGGLKRGERSTRLSFPNRAAVERPVQVRANAKKKRVPLPPKEEAFHFREGSSRKALELRHPILHGTWGKVKGCRGGRAPGGGKVLVERRGEAG